MLFGETLTLPRGGTVTFVPGFIPPREADALLARLSGELPWEQRDIVLFGRSMPQPRLISWSGELPYRYSGQTLEPRPPGLLVRVLLARVNAATGAELNHVLLNRYRDGRDSMGYHADDEPELGREPTVASLSFGTPRRFVLRARRGPKAPPVAFELGHGDLLVMAGRCQHEYRHAIPKQPHLRGERISLTLRRVLRPPASPTAGEGAY